MLNKFIASYLSFTKKERNGTILLLIIIICFSIAPFTFPFFIKEKKYDHAAFEKEIASLKIIHTDTGDIAYKRKTYTNKKYASYAGGTDYNTETAGGSLFYFDPNTLDKEGWQKLGVREKTATTILKYIAKGGSFKKAEDLHKIFGLNKNQIEKLLPFVQITNNSKPKDEVKKYDNTVYEKRQITALSVDINEGDSTAYIALPGIGSKLAQRIITFRERLGGFYSTDQIGETFGLPDSVFQKIKPMLRINNALPKQLNINTATMDELKAHPYLRYAIANAIVQYRSQHGNFVSTADLKKIMLVTEALYSKASPYLKAE